MNIRTKLLVTLLGAALAGPALAAGDDAVVDDFTDTWTVVTTAGFVPVSGHIEVASKSSAVVDQDQTALGNNLESDTVAEATVDGGSLDGAEGNIGVNVSAGVGNLQSNDAALSASDGDMVFAQAEVFSSQAAYGNTVFAEGSFTSLEANVEGNALAGARGNIGLNVAAGAGNTQSNGMAASANSSGNLALASADSEQDTWQNLYLSWGFDNSLGASLSGNAMAGAQGNVGANLAAGVGNAQHNALSIASASCGNCP